MHEHAVDLDERPDARFDSIGVAAGSYGPLEIGASREELVAALGEKEPASRNERLSPTGAGDRFFGPTFVGARPEHGIYRYPDVSVWLDPNGRVEGFELTSPGAATEKGIEIGSDLDDVREAYPDLRCGRAPQGDMLEYPYCAGRVDGGRYVWFGGDPVADITVSSSRLG